MEGFSTDLHQIRNDFRDDTCSKSFFSSLLSEEDIGPEKTAEELSEDGWFTTGDLGQVDGDGYLTIVGRGKDLIISGGYNIYPKEVEEAIDQLPGVLESAVIGLPHPDLGEGVVAIVARHRGADPDPQAIIAGLTERLARFKQPRHVVIVDELPRNAMGKVQKAALRQDHAGLFD